MAVRRSQDRRFILPVHGNFLIGLFLAVSVLAVFGQVSDHGFINFDDEDYVYDNPWVRSGLTSEGIRWALTAHFAGNWHPLTWISHMVDVSLFGVRPGPHHLISVGIHLANALLLFFALNSMTGRRWPSATVAAMFALHPLHVESVAWISERKDVLSAFFWMLTLLAYARYAARPAISRYLAVFCALAAGLMAKPMLVTLPAVLLLLDIWPLNRLVKRGWKWCLLEKLPLIGLAVGSAVITLIAQKGGGAVRSLEALSPWDRAGNAILAYAGYIAKMFRPIELAIFYPLRPEGITGPRVGGAALLIASVTVLVFLWGRSRPYFLVGWLWYLGTLIPVIGIVQVGSQAMADRYTYIPLIGLFIIIAWGLPDLLPMRQGYRLGLAGATAIAMVGIMTLTFQQVGYWKNSATLFAHTLRVTQNNALAHTHLGLALSQSGRLRAAIAEYQKALALSPIQPRIHNNLGVALYRSGEASAAVAHFRAALAIRPDFSDAQHNLRRVMAVKDRLPEPPDQTRNRNRTDDHVQR